MTIDYDRLRLWLDMVEDVDSAGIDERAAAYDLLEQRGPDLAAELMRLRDGVNGIRAELNVLAGMLATDGCYAQANYVREYTDALTDLLDGETNDD